MKNKLNICVVGTGHLGKLHTKMFKEIDKCNLVGIYDSNMEQAKQVGEEFNANVFDSIIDLLNQADAVSIAATTSAHYELAKKCLDAGKHIFIEKPITATIPQAEEIVELADFRWRSILMILNSFRLIDLRN
jgi:predicted dehydrogenase